MEYDNVNSRKEHTNNKALGLNPSAEEKRHYLRGMDYPCEYYRKCPLYEPMKCSSVMFRDNCRDRFSKIEQRL